MQKHYGFYALCVLIALTLYAGTFAIINSVLTHVPPSMYVMSAAPASVVFGLYFSWFYKPQKPQTA